MTSVEIDDNSTLFIVDDDSAIRESLSDLMDSVGVKSQVFASAEEFMDSRNAKMSGCLLLDVRLPGMSGLEMQSELSQSCFALPIIIMTAHGDMPMVRKAMKAGAIEFLIKPFTDEELLQVVQQAFELDRARRRAGDIVRSIQERAETLNERERQVLELVTAGLTNKEVADKLHLSVVTIKLYRGQMMRKMHAETLADLVKMREKINLSSGSKTCS